jgi:hypothetical protein
MTSLDYTRAVGGVKASLTVLEVRAIMGTLDLREDCEVMYVRDQRRRWQADRDSNCG